MKDVILLLALLGLTFGGLTMTSTVGPQLVGIGILTVVRPLFYTAISDYAAKVFGYVPPCPFGAYSTDLVDRFDNFGTVYGLAMTLSGLLGLLLTPMDILTKSTLGGNYTPINVVLLILGLISALGMYARLWSYTPSGKISLDVDGNHAGVEAGRSGISQAIVEEDEDE